MAKVMFLSIAFFAFVSTSKASSQRFVKVENSQAHARNFQTYKSHRLLAVSARNVTTLVKSVSHCAITCMENSWCVSYNVGKIARKDGKYACEALSADLYNSSNGFKSSDDFDHFTIASPCSHGPCQNGGTCIALYDEDDYQCVCPFNFYGADCETRLFPSCNETLKTHGSLENRAYLLALDSKRVHVYCHMTEIHACGAGGWTLVMKLNGSKETFGFGSPYWGDKIMYNVEGGKTGLDYEQTKLPTYWNTSFTKICLGMRVGSETHFILLQKSASSLYSLIADGVCRTVSLSRETWKSLITGSSLQQNCNIGGFNCIEGKTTRARIGFSANNEWNCKTPDSIIGFGTMSRFDHITTCGNFAYGSYSDNGQKSIPTMGYIFVQ